MAELSEAEPPKKRRRGPGRPFKPGQSGNAGGQSKEKRDFLERLRTEDADEVYRAMMDLVGQRNGPAVLRAWEYIVGKPPETVNLKGNVTVKGDEAQLEELLRRLVGE